MIISCAIEKIIVESKSTSLLLSNDTYIVSFEQILNFTLQVSLFVKLPKSGARVDDVVLIHTTCM